MAVQMLNEEWHDAPRARVVPVRIYYPADDLGPRPVIVFSHGVGGSRVDYAYLGTHWAGQGYVCVHLEHLGSNAAVWQGQRDPMGALRRAVLDAENAKNRALDVRFAIDRLEEGQRSSGPLQGRLDLTRIGAAGHSFGAATMLVATGQAVVDAHQREHDLADERIRAAVVLSPSAPLDKDRLSRIFAGVRVPVMHITGTNDESPIGLTSAAERRTAFDHIRHAEQWLVVFRDADHMTFTDAKRGRPARGRRAVVHPLVQAISTLFWAAYLNADGSAVAQLGERLATLLAGEASVERKVADR
jgi:predicted dienelactone hydrolase